MAEPRPKPFQARSLTSLTLVLSFLWMTFSGLVLYLGPPGGQARRAGWTYARLGRDDWMAQHMTSSLVFLIAASAHLWLNRRALWRTIHSKARRGLNRRWEMLAAAALTAFMIAGTIWELPPWNGVLAGSRHIQSYRAEEKQERQGRRQGQKGGAKDGKGPRKGYRGGRGAKTPASAGP